MIDSYSFGSLVANGSTYRQDVIIFPDRIQDATRRFVEANGIELRAANTEEACCLYNELAASRKSVDLHTQSKPDVFHTYLQNFQLVKTCDITYPIRSDGRGECAINPSC